jgi:hypothetical protein
VAAKKKSRKLKKLKSQKLPHSGAENPDIAKPSQDQGALLDVGKLADDLTGKVRNLFSKPAAAEVAPELPQNPTSPADHSQEDFSTMSQTPSLASASNVSQLAETVAQIHDQFGPSPDTPPGGSASSEPPPPIDPGPGVVEPPDHDFMPRETIAQILELIFSGVAKRYGKQHELSPDESRALTPLTVDMVNEQGPRLFGESENRALWIWLTVMGIFIAARSESGARLVEWFSDIVTGAGKNKVAKPKPEKTADGKADAKKDSTEAAADSTKLGSLEFRAGSGFQAPVKQP